MEGETRYAKSGDVHIAYRVFGAGPRDVVLVPGTVSHVELYWELPANRYLLKRLASFSRVIVFDKRGQGLSDRVGDQTLEERVDDVLAVMNAAASDRATIYGWSEGGQLSLTLAARHSSRASLGARPLRDLCVDRREPRVVRAIPREAGEALGRRRARPRERAEPAR